MRFVLDSLIAKRLTPHAVFAGLAIVGWPPHLDCCGAPFRAAYPYPGSTHVFWNVLGFGSGVSDWDGVCTHH